MGLAPRPTAASRVMATEESARAISSRHRQNVRKSPSSPPYRSGNGRPNSPSSPIWRTISRGKRSSRSSPSAEGATISSANCRTAFWKSSCSSVRPKSTGYPAHQVGRHESGLPVRLLQEAPGSFHLLRASHVIGAEHPPDPPDPGRDVLRGPLRSLESQELQRLLLRAGPVPLRQQDLHLGLEEPVDRPRPARADDGGRLLKHLPCRLELARSHQRDRQLVRRPGHDPPLLQLAAQSVALPKVLHGLVDATGPTVQGPPGGQRARQLPPRSKLAEAIDGSVQVRLGLHQAAGAAKGVADALPGDRHREPV